VAQKKRPELSHGVMQRSRWSESAEKHDVMSKHLQMCL